jgi:hypothetical protein
MTYYKELGKKLKEHHAQLAKKAEEVKKELVQEAPEDLDSFAEVAEAIHEIINNMKPGVQENIYNLFLNPNMFSLEEKIIGCWINGKPLYEKTFATKVPRITAQIALNFCDLDIENIINFISTFSNGEITNPGPSQSGDNYLSFWYNKSAKLLHIACTEEQWSGWDLYITIQYTKTSDEENSFNNDMLDYVEIQTSSYSNEDITNAVNALW